MKIIRPFLIVLIIFLAVIVVGQNFSVWQERQSLKFDRKIIEENPSLEIWSSSNNEVEEIKEDDSLELRFLFFGDLMLDRHVGEIINRQGLDSLFSLAEAESFFENYDLISANLEGAVTNEGQHYPPHNLYDFAFKPEIIKELKKYNINFFNLANNHLSDQGRIGIEETYRNLSQLGFYYSGCQDAHLAFTTSSESVILGEEMPILDFNNCSDVVLEIKGERIVFLGFSSVYRDIDEQEVLNRIKDLKDNNDLVIVNVHFGQEYQERANDKQRSLARAMVEAGADLIIGHHPHVVQDYEVYQDKPIFYSLGNFIFDQYFSDKTQEGLAIEVNFKKDSEVYKIDFKPYLIKTKQSSISQILEILP